MTFASHILVPTDFSHASELALRAAIVLSSQLSAKVTLLHVHDPEALRPPATIGMSPEQRVALEKQVHASVEATFEALVRDRFPELASAERVIVHDASAAHGICAHAEKAGVQLIVIATHGRTGLAHLLIGSVAERVVRHA